MIVVVSRACEVCGADLRFDPWLGRWVDRHHAWQVGKLRRSAGPAGPHVHVPGEAETLVSIARP
jgi:hypothetical protein